MVHSHVHEGAGHPRRADLEVQHGLLELHLHLAVAPAAGRVGVHPSDAAEVAAHAMLLSAVTLWHVDLGAHSVATLHVDARQLALHVFAASLQAASS